MSPAEFLTHVHQQQASIPYIVAECQNLHIQHDYSL